MLFVTCFRTRPVSLSLTHIRSNSNAACTSLSRRRIPRKFRKL